MENSEHKRNREKKEGKLAISVLNEEVLFLNFLSFVTFTILLTF